MSDRRSVELIEVGPRDGLQNESTPSLLADKLMLIERLIEAGCRRIEATSFVSPKAFPQLADADELLPALPDRPDIDFICLVPNERGYERAIAAGARHVEIFTAATDAFCQANIRCTIDESFDRFAPVMERAAADGVAVRGAVSVAFHCPYSGPVDPVAAVTVAKRLLESDVPKSRSPTPSAAPHRTMCSDCWTSPCQVCQSSGSPCTSTTPRVWRSTTSD